MRQEPHGEQLPTYEEHRHRCEVRQVLKWRVERGSAWVHAWLESAATKRPVARLRRDCAEQWGKGNRGEVCLILHALKPFQWNAGERIAQGIIIDVHREKIALVDELSSTDRNAGGFGSTGK